MKIPLHPAAADFVKRLERPGTPMFYQLPVADQRIAQEKMLQAFGPSPVAMAQVREATIGRPDAAGGDLSFRLYRPLSGGGGAQSDKPLPALCWFHGGGFTVGSLAGFDGFFRQLAQLSGCVLLAPAYRLAPEHPFPAALEDSLYALRWFIGNAAMLGIDASRLAVGGDSAGGNLATLCALHNRDERGPALAFQLLVYPDTDKRGLTASHTEFAAGCVLTRELLQTFRRNYLPDPATYSDWRASPVLAPSLAGLPPTLIVAASHDPLRDDGLAYAARLREAGVPVEHVAYAGMVHNFFTLGGIIPAASEAVAFAALRLRQALHLPEEL